MPVRTILSRLLRALAVAGFVVLALSGCAGPMAESYEFVYGPLPGSEPEVFEQLTSALAARGAVILEADAATGRVVVAVRSVRGANGSPRAVFQCYQGGYVRSSLEGVEPDGPAGRIHLARATRDGYEEVAVGLFADVESNEASR